MGIVQVGFILSGNCPGGSYHGREFSLLGVFRVETIRRGGGNYRGDNFPGGSFPSTEW